MRTLVPRYLWSYSYAGMGYANRHAVTSVGGATYTYDNNGNVTAIGSLDYTWDWRNRLSSAERSSGGTTSYGYDHTGQRVFQATGSATTSYPNRYYNVASSSLTATTTKHIFSSDGTLFATVVGASTTASTTYLHPDHLGGTNVVTDEDGEVTQTLDYYPYGSQRIASGSFSEQRRFIGEEFDGDTEFSYLNARYYQGSRGQFMSQDPVFLTVGSKDHNHLSDPQSLNSYGYSRNNPLRLKDPGGKDFIEIGFSAAVGPYAAGVGLRFDSRGVDAFYSAGGGVGFGGGFYGKYSLGDLSHTPTLTTSREIYGADVWGATASYEGNYDPDCSLCVTNGAWSGGIMVGAGAGAYQQITQSFPLITTSGVRQAIERTSSRTFSYDRYDSNISGIIQSTGGNGSGSRGATQSASGSSGSYRPASAYGFRGDSNVTVQNVDAVVSFIKQFLK